MNNDAKELSALFDTTQDCDSNTFIKEMRKIFKSKIPSELRGLSAIKEIPVDSYSPGIYFLIKDNNIVYIGKALNPISRILDHRGRKNFDTAYLLAVPIVDHHNGLEGALIRLFKPCLNARNNGNEFEDHKYLYGARR